jgi:hypothetical protein
MTHPLNYPNSAHAIPKFTTMLDDFQPLFRKFSREYNCMDYDDCVQHASLLMLETWAKLPDSVNAKNVEAYLYGVCRRGLYQLLVRKVDRSVATQSLDRPRKDDGTMCLADTIQATESRRTEAELDYLDEVTETVHSALRSCRIEEQEYAVKAFELPDYTPVAPMNYSKTGFTALYHKRNFDKPRRADNMRRSMKAMFSKHPQVLSLLQRETCVL